MADGKKSALIYSGLITTVEKISNENAGLLFKHLLRYINDLNQEVPNETVDLVFEPIKQSLKRDLKKWERIRQRNIENANKRWGKEDVLKVPNDAVNVSVSVNDSVNDSVKVNVKYNIELRKQKFATTLQPFLEKYGKDMLNDFYVYWTEPNKSNTKFKQELEKTWGLEKRLNTWAKNDSSFNKNKNKEDTTKPQTTHLNFGTKP